MSKVLVKFEGLGFALKTGVELRCHNTSKSSEVTSPFKTASGRNNIGGVKQETENNKKRERRVRGAYIGNRVSTLSKKAVS